MKLFFPLKKKKKQRSTALLLLLFFLVVAMDPKIAMVVKGQLETAIRSTAKSWTEGYYACCRSVPLLNMDGGLVSLEDALNFISTLMDSFSPKPIPEHIREKLAKQGKLPQSPLDHVVVFLFCPFQNPHDAKDHGVLVVIYTPAYLCYLAAKLYAAITNSVDFFFGCRNIDQTVVLCENPETKADELTFQAIQKCRKLKLLPYAQDSDVEEDQATAGADYKTKKRKLVTFNQVIATDTKVDHLEDIRNAAYFAWLNEGCRPGQDLNYWLQAERQLGC
jgi:hypothetical protein